MSLGLHIALSRALPDLTALHSNTIYPWNLS